MKFEDESDLYEIYKAMKEKSRIKKESNKESSTKLLDTLCIDYESKNNGLHLIVFNENEIIDFWPSTGKFIPRKGKAGRGVFNLIKRIKNIKQM
jgi:hypothetical protein